MTGAELGKGLREVKKEGKKKLSRESSPDGSARGLRGP